MLSTYDTIRLIGLAAFCFFAFCQPSLNPEKRARWPNARASKWMLAVSLGLNVANWISTFTRTYLIGMIEALLNVIFKRGLFGCPPRASFERAVDYFVEQYRKAHPDERSNAVVTGGDTGIGFEIARGLLEAGFHVIIETGIEKEPIATASQTPEAGEAAQTKLQDITGNQNVSYVKLNLLSHDNVLSFCDEVMTKIPRGQLNLLINNAGVMNPPCQMTEDKIESQYQVNCLSPFLLTIKLLPWMRPNGRVLFASSSTLYTISQLDFKMQERRYGMSGLTHYSYSKICVALLACRLGNILSKQKSEIKVLPYHPGVVRTRLFNTTTIFTWRIFSRILDYIMLSPKEGSKTPIFLSLWPDLNIAHDHVWMDMVPYPVPFSDEPDTLDTLWNDSLKRLRGLDAEKYISSCLSDESTHVVY
ncbi:hypothetical protein DFQ28_009039 [Apophysomyces sp. BC1034]|nr:hypothetical protein DFQ30_007545 [Apophysomyces sp. BC1015]KAG0180956.1 hypothetical protein DFQ29_009706 [Apophysomyces sp. BC1021]KAG0185636.1 hypothetical protein DFQ28_009039 [Apophysomyces sp. BC1034]